jgi:lambda family phage portal protein
MGLASAIQRLLGGHSNNSKAPPAPASITTSGRPAPRANGFGGQGLDAAGTGRRLRSFRPSRQHINQLIASAGPTTVARARYLVRNNGYAVNAVDAWTSHAVGTGIKPNPSPRSLSGTERDRLMRKFRRWTDDADADGATDFYGLQRNIARECFIAGEVFVRFRLRRREDGLEVPLQLQVLPAEMLDVSFNLEPPSGNIVRNGIEFDALGRRVAYHFWKVHPGDTSPSDGTMRTVVPASEILHIYDPLEAQQVRGLSRLTPAIVKLFMLDAYDDAELDRKKTAAMFAGFVKRNVDGRDPFAEDGDEEPEAAGPSPHTGGLLPMEPGLIQYLDEGEEIQWAAPADVGGSYEAFQYRTLMQIAAALGVPYMFLTGDMVKANYSNTRAALLDFRRRVEAFQHGVLVFQFCRAVWARWLDLAILTGSKVSARGEDMADLEQPDWLPPRWEWMDPQKDANAEIAQINAKLKSRTQALAERGCDAEQVDQEIAEDQAREKRLGLAPAYGDENV